MKTDRDFQKFQDWKKEDEKANLIPVHINKTRSQNFYWNWSKDKKDWVRGEEIPEAMKKAYQNPPTKSNYK